MALTIPLWIVLLVGFSMLMFAAATAVCLKLELFEDRDGFGGRIESMMAVLFYAVIWVIPSLLCWAVFVTRKLVSA